MDINNATGKEVISMEFTPTNHLLNSMESYNAYYDVEGRVQPIDIIEQYKLDFYEGNALKYLLRYKEKDGLKDLNRLAQYVKWLIVRESLAYRDCQGDED